jgi:hypothetical protein
MKMAGYAHRAALRGGDALNPPYGCSAAR